MRGKNCLNSFISFPDSDEGEEGALVSRNVRPNTCKANGGSDSFVPSSRRQNQVQDKTKFKTKPSSRQNQVQDDKTQFKTNPSSRQNQVQDITKLKTTKPNSRQQNQAEDKTKFKTKPNLLKIAFKMHKVSLASTLESLFLALTNRLFRRREIFCPK